MWNSRLPCVVGESCRSTTGNQMRFGNTFSFALTLTVFVSSAAYATDLDTRAVTRSAATAVPVSKLHKDLFLPTAIAANPEWGVLVFGGASAGRTELYKIILTPWNGDYTDNYFVGGALSRRLVQLHKHWTIEAEIGAGYRFKQVDAPEGWVAAYLRFDGLPWNHWVYTTIAASVGLSYVGTVSELEKASSIGHGNPNGSKLLHYFSPEFTFADPNHRDWEFVVRYHHRSGVMGLFNSVWGGSNIVTGGVRHRF
jgi:hypothetical protein